MKLYLDVDGVINAQMPPWKTVETRTVSGYRVRWSPDMIRELRGLGLELNWLTSWGSAAPENLAYELEYGHDAPLAALPPLNWYSTMDWKYPAVQGREGRHDRFVWIDDELNPLDSRGRIGMEAVNFYRNALLIAPDSRLGITPRHIARIKAYMNGG